MVGEVQFRCEGWVGGLENEEQEWLEKCSVDGGWVGDLENGEIKSIEKL